MLGWSGEDQFTEEDVGLRGDYSVEGTETGDGQGDMEGKKSIALTSLTSNYNQIPEDLLQLICIVFISSGDNSNLPPNFSAAGSRNPFKPNSHSHKQQDHSSESRIDAVFSWPRKSKSRKVQPLVASHGMFSTLYKLLVDVTGSHPLLSRVKMDGDLTDICYVSDNDGDGLLLVAFAHSASPRFGGMTSNCLLRFATRLVQSLVFKWGSLTRAFRTTKEKEMGRFLSNVTASLIYPSPHDFLFLNQPPVIRSIPKTILLGIQEILYNLESSDFYEKEVDEDLGETEPPSQYHCLGSILFFKGQLVTSHLDNPTQAQFYSWMKTELNQWAPSKSSWTFLRPLTLWQPAFLRPCPSEVNEQEDQVKFASSCQYAVLLGLDSFLLGFILEPVTPCPRLCGADALWIGQGMESLIELVRSDVTQFLQMGVQTASDRVEIVPTSGSNEPASHYPQVTGGNVFSDCVDSKGGIGPPLTAGVRINEGETSGNFSTCSFHPSASPHSSGQSPNTIVKSLIDDLEASHLLERKDVADGGTTTPSDASSSKMSGDGGSDTTSTDRLQSCVENPRETMSTVSICKGNFIYDFVQVEHGRGVLISTDENENCAYAEILRNFRRHAIFTHEILHKAANSRRKLGNREGDWKWVSKALTPISEHGSLFECQVHENVGGKKKKKWRKLSYWVIGRLYEDQKEIYICLQDTLEHHNVLELAFKIAHVTGAGSNRSYHRMSNRTWPSLKFDL
ncbi:unnamed protein product [Allacma fusca]|uniref:Uncharacterized protein n=1 Tax=Allacma fusca TaxID=39272 RepID=A0A8J2PJ15_9HEXA|nr:unnamed protein product [Allacma fusca]